MMISGIYALTTQTTQTGLATGNIDIDLETYELSKENQEILYGTESTVYMPGEDVSLIPKIQNLGDDCYIRVKIEYITDEINFEDYNINMPTTFELYDDYYYYKNVVKSNDVIKIFDGVKIPENLSQKKIELTITAQAIQAKNFEPDYTFSNPWKNIQPVESSNTSYNLDSKNNSITIIFEDGAEKDVTIKNDFFANIPNILPGDIFEDTLEINNKSKNKAKYYLNYREQGKEYEILEKLEFIITNKKGNIIYSGKIKNIKNLLLGEYNFKDNDRLTVKLVVPVDLENEFEKIIPKFDLIISVDYEENTEKNIIDVILENGGLIIEKSGIVLKNPITGDSINLAIIIFLISAICLIFIMILAYKKKRNEE